MGTLNSMKDECSPLGVPTQDQLTIQSLHSAHSFQSDQEDGTIAIARCKTVAIKTACMAIEA